MANAFKSYVSSSIGTSIVTIITSTASTTIIGCSLANVASVAITASAYVQKSGGGTAYIVKNAPIPVGGALVVIGAEQKVVLEVGDMIKVISNTVGSVDSLISTLEIS
jgi:hypothetical protein